MVPIRPTPSASRVRPIRRVVLVGLGKAGRAIHLPALRKLAALEIVGVHDLTDSGANIGLPMFLDFDRMLRDTNPDLVVIATPPASHASLTKSALIAGCHVFCEKPLAETLEDAQELVTLARACGREIIVNSEFPFMPIHWDAKRRMAEPGFGALQFVSIHQTFLVTPETEQGWRGEDTRRTLKEFGTHVLDLAKFFFGENPIRLRARMPRPGNLNGPDYLNLIELEFSGQRFAQITLDRLSKGRHRYLDIRLDGAEATIETQIGGRAEVTFGLKAATRRPFVDVDLAMGGRARLYRGETFEPIATAPLDLFADATSRLLCASIEALQAGQPLPYTLQDAFHTLKMLLACYEIESGTGIDCAAW